MFLRFLVCSLVACVGFVPFVEAATLRDKSEIIEEVANMLLEAYASRVKGKVVAVASPKGKTEDFTADERAQVRQRFISKIQASGYIVVDDDNLDSIKAVEEYQASGAVSDKQVQKMGNKAGVQQIIVLTFSEVVGKYDASEADVTLTVDLRATEVKTGKINIAKSVEVKYEHILYKESYYARDMGSFALGTLKWTSLVGSVYYVVIGAGESEKANSFKSKADDKSAAPADKATYSEKEEKHRKQAREDYRYAGGLAGAFILSWIFQHHLDSLPRDEADYHKYRLAVEPHAQGGTLSATFKAGIDL